jgi:hypothetical protein
MDSKDRTGSHYDLARSFGLEIKKGPENRPPAEPFADHERTPGLGPSYGHWIPESERSNIRMIEHSPRKHPFKPFIQLSYRVPCVEGSAVANDIEALLHARKKHFHAEPTPPADSELATRDEVCEAITTAFRKHPVQACPSRLTVRSILNSETFWTTVVLTGAVIIGYFGPYRLAIISYHRGCPGGSSIFSYRETVCYTELKEFNVYITPMNELN